MAQANSGITTNNLARLPLNQLAAAYDAFSAAAAAIHAVYNQPRVEEVEDILLEEQARADRILEQIVEVAVKAKPANPQESRHRLNILMECSARFDDRGLEIEIARDLLALMVELA